MLKLHMFVYNNINTDARVQRCICALKEHFDCFLFSIEKQWIKPECENEVLISKKNGNIFKYFDVLYKFIRVENAKSCDIFYAHDFSSALQALYMKLCKKCKWLVYDAHELFIPEDGTHKSLRDWFFYYAEKWAICNADLIICAQEDRGRIMQKHYALADMPIVIRNISILPKCSKMSNTQLEEKIEAFFAKDGLTVVYTGAIEKERQIDKMIDAVTECKLTKCKVLIIGKGSQTTRLKKMVSDRGLQNVLFVSSMPYNELSFVLTKCDIGYVNYEENCLNTKYCSPNKLFEYASVNLPMISYKNSTIHKILRKYNIGCSGDNIDISLCNVISHLSEMRVNCKYFVEQNKWQDEEKKLLCAIKALTTKE